MIKQRPLTDRVQPAAAIGLLQLLLKMQHPALLHDFGIILLPTDNLCRICQFHISTANNLRSFQAKCATRRLIHQLITPDVVFGKHNVISAFNDRVQ